MSATKYNHVVVIRTEDGCDYLNKRNGVMFSNSEYGKRFTLDGAIAALNEYIDANEGRGLTYGIHIAKVKRRTRGEFRRYLREVAAERREIEAEYAASMWY